MFTENITRKGMVRFYPLKQGVFWWRRRESNSGPRMLQIRFYVRSPYFEVSLFIAPTDRLSESLATLESRPYAG